jgi:hypothetical protein
MGKNDFSETSRRYRSVAEPGGITNRYVYQEEIITVWALELVPLCVVVGNDRRDVLSF